MYAAAFEPVAFNKIPSAILIPKTISMNLLPIIHSILEDKQKLNMMITLC
jgi:hypothetical protein